MQNIQFSRRSGCYNYAAELKYLSSLPQTQDVVRRRVDLIYDLALRDIPYFAAYEKQLEFEESKFNPSQPRVPAGSSGGGQWVGDNIGRGNDDNITTGTVKPRAIPRLPMPYALLAQGALELYNRYNEWASQNQTYPNDGSAVAIIEFENREYRPVEGGQILDIVGTRLLTRDETRIACPRLDEVQYRVNRIDADVRDANPYLTAQQHGTAVHVRLANEIKAQDNPEFVAEVSILKSEAESRFSDYGRANTIRIDILEKVDKETVCVYDLKTGRAGLSTTRSKEIAGEVFKAFGKAHQRIIVTEVRPKK